MSAMRIKRPDTAFSLDPTSKATKSFSDQKHTDFIKRMPSILSGATGCDPCHISAGSPVYNKKRTGMGQRASDCWLVPMTRAEHDAQHSRGDELAFYREHGIADPFDIAVQLYAISGDDDAGRRIIAAIRRKVELKWQS